jgi:hypothetical protein
VDFTLALACRPADRSFERDLARRARGSNRGKIPYRLHGADGTDKSSKDKSLLPRCQKFEANTTNTTAGKREIRSVKILLADPVSFDI